MKIRGTIFLSAFVIASSPLSAQMSQQSMTGNELLATCSVSDDLAKQGFCLGYIVGAIEGMKWGAALPLLQAGVSGDDANIVIEGTLEFCLPVDATWGQYQDVVKAYLNQNPQSRHNSARLLTQAALIQAFPCGFP